MRLHALVLGALAGCGLAGISYDPKVDVFLAQLGLAPAARTGSDASAEDVADAIVRELGSQDAGEVSERLNSLKSDALRNVDILAAAAGR